MRIGTFVIVRDNTNDDDVACLENTLTFIVSLLDTARYKLVGDELVWDRGFGRPANAVVLPTGWALTNSSIPATVTTLPDGRVRLDFINPRPDEIQVLITARRR